MKTRLRKIILAVDPFTPELKPSKTSLMELRTWLRDSNAHLEIVHVFPLSPAKEHLFDSCTITEQFLRQYAAELGFEPTQTRVLLEQSSSTRRTVHTLTDYARRTGADLILLTSHGRKIAGRLLMGSFADALIVESPVPVLFLGSESTRQHWSNTALFPTDFSKSSRIAFDWFLDQFSATKPHVILYHLDFLAPFLNSTFAGFKPTQQMIDERIRHDEEEGNQWLERAHSKGYSAVYQRAPHFEDLAKAIVELAEREQIGVVAMASMSRPPRLRSVWSVASSIFYQHTFPVWVCGPEAVKNQPAAGEEAAAPRAADTKPSSFPLSDYWS